MTVFHKIVAGELPAYIIAEDERHLAFLDIYPSVEGQTVVIPKVASTSKFSEVPEETMQSTMLFAQDVAKLLEENLEDVARCVIEIEGFEVNYFHVKILPIKNRQNIAHEVSPRASNEDLERIQTLFS